MAIYIVRPRRKKIPSWSDGTNDEIVSVITGYYNGDYSLEDIEKVWNIGEARTVNLSAMTRVAESHRAQNVDLVILGFNHDKLTTSINDKTKSLITVQVKNCLTASYAPTNSANDEAGYMNTTQDNTGGWRDCKRRTWCNDVFYEAIPTYLKNLIKPVDKLTSEGNRSSTIVTTSDKTFLVSEVEVFGYDSYYGRSKPGEGSRYEYFKTVSNIYKRPPQSSGANSASWWERSPGRNDYDFCCTDSSGERYSSGASDNLGIAPAFCL